MAGRVLRSKASAARQQTPPPTRRGRSFESSDEDDDGITHSPWSKRNAPDTAGSVSRHSSALRPNVTRRRDPSEPLADDPPSKKRRTEGVEPRVTRRRGTSGTHKTAPLVTRNKVSSAGSDAEADEDDDAAPAEHVLAGINRTILGPHALPAIFGEPRGSIKDRIRRQLRQAAEQDDDQDNEPEQQDVDHHNDEAEQEIADHQNNDDEGEQEVGNEGEYTEEDVAPPDPSSQASRHSRQLATGATFARTRNKAKAAFGERGYQEPGAVSDLGTEAPVNPLPKGKRGRQPKKQPWIGRKRRAAPKSSADEEAAGIENAYEFEISHDESCRSPSNSQAEDEPSTIAESEQLQTFLEAPEDANERVAVNIAGLRSMLSTLGGVGWTDGKRNWTSYFVEKEAATFDAWNSRSAARLKRHELLRLRIYSLREMCREVREGRLRWHTDDLNGLMHEISILTEEFAAQMENNVSKKAPNLRKAFRIDMTTLRRRTIPWLVLLLDSAALLGVKDERENAKGRTPMGEFTHSTLKFLIRITGWTERLVHIAVDKPHTLASNSSEPDTAKDENRRALPINLAAFQRRLGAALGKLEVIQQTSLRWLEAEENARQRDRRDKLARKEALEEAQRAQLVRDEEARLRREADDLQHQLWVRSTLRMGPVDEYAMAHGGWSHDEDTCLLEMIRRVARPDMGQLARLTPGRSVAAVEARVKHLRRRFWHQYTNEGRPPPRWCYEPPRLGQDGVTMDLAV